MSGYLLHQRLSTNVIFLRVKGLMFCRMQQLLSVALCVCLAG